MTDNSFVLFLLSGLLGSLLGAPAAAQGARSCPDMVTRDIPGTSQVVGVHRCGTGISGNIGGLVLTIDSPICPSMLIVTGARNEPDSRPNSGTYVEQSGTAESRAYVYKCTTHKFLIFSVGDSCDFVTSNVIATLPVYTVHRCERPAQ